MENIQEQINKSIETALVFLQYCEHCNFYFLVEASLAEYFSCPNCVSHVKYSEDFAYSVIL